MYVHTHIQVSCSAVIEGSHASDFEDVCGYPPTCVLHGCIYAAIIICVCSSIECRLS
jgi:hypothetical protein